MKNLHIKYLLLFLFAAAGANAQVFIPGQEGLCVDKKATMYISPSTSLYINGNFFVKESQFPRWVRSNGTITLTGNLECNDPLICERASSSTPTSQFIFKPKTGAASITSYTDSLVLYHTIIDKPGSVVTINPGSNVKILDTIDLRAGSIRLDGGNILLSFPSGTPSYVNHPYIKNENHQNRIFGDSGQVIISATATNSYLIGPATYSFANLGLVLKGPNVQSSRFTIKRGHAKQLYAGNGSIARYFDIKVDSGALTSDSLLISYIDSAEFINLGINRNRLKVFATRNYDDMDYFQLGSSNVLAQTLARCTTSDLAIAYIDPQKFRVTVADEDCPDPPVSSLLSDTVNMCQGAVSVLDAGNAPWIPNTALFWNWSTNDTTQTISVNSPGSPQTITVSIRDLRGCITRDTVVLMPAPNPVALMYGASACYGDSIRLKSNSSIGSGSITNYYWQFGDASTYSTSLNDTIHKWYASPGSYAVTLIVTSNFGCTDTVLQNVVSLPPPVAAFSSLFNCAADSMEFTSNSSVPPLAGAITQNYWNFDTVSFASPALYSPAVNPSFHYSTAGNYWVKLVVRTGLGCRDSITQNITIVPRNTPSFSISNLCFGDTADFTNSSVCNTGSCSYLWDFGDGSQSVAANPAKIYPAAGAYNVKLKVSAANACTDSVIVPLIINAKPTVSFATNPVCEGDITYLTNNTTISSGTITGYLWDAGNATTSVSFNHSLVYAVPGIYPVTLTATSDSGCVASQSANVTVHANPTAQYSISNNCLNQVSAFTGNSIGNGLLYVWNFGNSATSSLSNPNYTYPAAGTYTTSLVVSDINGCSDTATAGITVYPVPNPALGGTISTCGTSYPLNAGPGVSYLWQPVNATTSSIIVTANGIYSVIVTDANGCVGMDQVQITLNSVVQPDLGPDTVSCGTYILNAGYPGSTYVWNTPGPHSQTLAAAVNGTYIVTVTDVNNCSGSDTVVVAVNPVPTLSLGADIIQCQTNQPVTLTPVTNAATFAWSTGAATPSVSVNTSGYYLLTVTGSNGCKAKDTLQLTLLPSPVVNLGTDATVCGSKLLDAQNTGFTYLWSDGSSAQTLTAQVSGQYHINVANPGNGCTGTDTINLVINTPLTLSLGADTTTCSSGVFVLDAGNPGAVYTWSTGQTTQTLQVGSGGVYGVTVTNGACSAFDAINISILSTPVVNLGTDIRYLCGNNTITLSANTAGTYAWGGSNGFNSTQSSIALSQAGTYWLQTSNGICSSADTVQIIQSNQALAAYFLASTLDTAGKPVQFVDVSQPVPTTWQWDFGDGFNSTEQNPEHTFLIPQSYSVSLTVGNGFCTSQITKSLQVVKQLAPHQAPNAVLLTLVNFDLFPNPTQGTFNTMLELNDVANISMNVYDISGKLLYNATRTQQSVFEEETNLPELSNGLYFIDIIAESPKGFIRQKGKLIVLK
ncbi:MAG: hypothetical protein K0S33_4151 [Bacteroidetes bacterium]|jgi:PKD repeat protein|nr:hypothetical protein [Bacteroidota bacterium]